MKAFLAICSIFLLSVDLRIVDAEVTTCKEMLSEITKRQMSAISACTKEMKFKNGKDKAAKMNCVMVCAMKREKVLDANGGMTIESLTALIEKEAPPALAELKPKAIGVLGKCVETTTANLDPNEEFCKSYDPLIKCFMKASGEICK